MKDNDLISVIIPIFNVEPYIRECIDSVIHQSYKNLEIILCDDGSTDLCPQICDEYVKVDSRIRVIHKKNGGLSDARNVGIDIANGEYITFVDSDDCIDKDMIRYLYDALIENRVDISCCQRQEINEDSIELNTKRKYHTFIVRGNEQCMKEFLSNPQMDTVAWGKLYRRSMFEEIRYPVGKYHEDVFTTYKIVAQCKAIFVGEKRYYCYRIRSSSIMTSAFSEKHLDAIEGQEERALFIKENYSNLEKLANVGIIYAVNQCVLKIIRSSDNVAVNKKRIISDFQQYYRKYELDFLQGTSGIVAKVFSIFACVNLSMLIHFLRKVYRVNR